MSITISAQNFATGILGMVDQVIGNFVQSGYTALVQGNAGVITALMTFYIILLGYRFFNHTLSADISTIARHLTALMIVYGFLLSWNLYWLFFYNFFTNEPLAIAQTLTSATGMLPPGQGSAAALDNAFSQGMQAANLITQTGTTLSPMPWIYGLVIFCMTVAFGAAALVLFVYAKIAMAVILVLGPIFLICLLWNSTRGFFDKWIQKLVNYALVPIVTSAMLMLVLAIDNNVLPGLLNTASSGHVEFNGIWPYLGFCLISALIFTQVLSICSALSGGISLVGISAALPLAGAAVTAIGAKHAAGAAGRFVANKLGLGKGNRSKQIKSDRT